MAITIDSFRSMVENANVLDGNIRLSQSTQSLVKVDFGGKLRKVICANARSSANGDANANLAVRNALVSALSNNGLKALPNGISALLAENDTEPLSRRVVKQVLAIYDADQARRAENANGAEGAAIGSGFRLTALQFNAMVDKGLSMLSIKDPVSMKKVEGYVQMLKDAFGRCGGDISRLSGTDRLLVREMKELLSGALNDQHVCEFLERRLPYHRFEQLRNVNGVKYDSRYVQDSVLFLRQLDKTMVGLQEQVKALKDAIQGDRNHTKEYNDAILNALGPLMTTLKNLNRNLFGFVGDRRISMTSHDQRIFHQAFEDTHTGVALKSLSELFKDMVGGLDYDKMIADSKGDPEYAERVADIRKYGSEVKADAGSQLRAQIKDMAILDKNFKPTTFVDAFRVSLASIFEPQLAES